MEIEIKKTVRILKSGFWAFWLIPVCWIIMGETDVIPVGQLVDDVRGTYFLQTACILLTAICVPLSLKLFSLVLTRKIDTYTFPVALSRYRLWSLVRLGLLELSVWVGLLGYYFTLSSTGALCALIGLTTSFFCFPSETKLREELHIANEIPNE